jgi:hypothetical protein
VDIAVCLAQLVDVLSGIVQSLEIIAGILDERTPRR